MNVKRLAENTNTLIEAAEYNVRVMYDYKFFWLVGFSFEGPSIYAHLNPIEYDGDMLVEELEDHEIIDVCAKAFASVRIESIML